METLLLTLHVVVGVFLVGPLVAAGNQAARALTDANAGALRLLYRMVTIYGWLSILVLVFGLAVVEDDWSAGWLIASLVLYVVGAALVLGVLAPLLRGAVETASAGGATAALARRAAALGGSSSLFFVTVTVLMVVQPGD